MIKSGKENDEFRSDFYSNPVEDLQQVDMDSDYEQVIIEEQQEVRQYNQEQDIDDMMIE